MPVANDYYLLPAVATPDAGSVVSVQEFIDNGFALKFRLFKAENDTISAKNTPITKQIIKLGNVTKSVSKVSWTDVSSSHVTSLNGFETTSRYSLRNKISFLSISLSEGGINVMNIFAGKMDTAGKTDTTEIVNPKLNIGVSKSANDCIDVTLSAKLNDFFQQVVVQEAEADKNVKFPLCYSFSWNLPALDIHRASLDLYHELTASSSSSNSSHADNTTHAYFWRADTPAETLKLKVLGSGRFYRNWDTSVFLNGDKSDDFFFSPTKGSFIHLKNEVSEGVSDHSAEHYDSTVAANVYDLLHGNRIDAVDLPEVLVKAEQAQIANNDPKIEFSKVPRLSESDKANLEKEALDTNASNADEQASIASTKDQTYLPYQLCIKDFMPPLIAGISPSSQTVLDTPTKQFYVTLHFNEPVLLNAAQSLNSRLTLLCVNPFWEAASSKKASLTQGSGIVGVPGPGGSISSTNEAEGYALFLNNPNAEKYSKAMCPSPQELSLRDFGEVMKDSMKLKVGPFSLQAGPWEYQMNLSVGHKSITDLHRNAFTSGGIEMVAKYAITVQYGNLHENRKINFYPKRLQDLHLQKEEPKQDTSQNSIFYNEKGELVLFDQVVDLGTALLLLIVIMILLLAIICTVRQGARLKGKRALSRSIFTEIFRRHKKVAEADRKEAERRRSEERRASIGSVASQNSGSHPNLDRSFSMSKGSGEKNGTKTYHVNVGVSRSASAVNFDNPGNFSPKPKFDDFSPRDEERGSRGAGVNSKKDKTSFFGGFFSSGGSSGSSGNKYEETSDTSDPSKQAKNAQSKRKANRKRSTSNINQQESLFEKIEREEREKEEERRQEEEERARRAYAEAENARKSQSSKRQTSKEVRDKKKMSRRGTFEAYPEGHEAVCESLDRQLKAEKNRKSDAKDREKFFKQITRC